MKCHADVTRMSRNVTRGGGGPLKKSPIFLCSDALLHPFSCSVEVATCDLACPRQAPAGSPCRDKFGGRICQLMNVSGRPSWNQSCLLAASGDVVRRPTLASEGPRFNNRKCLTNVRSASGGGAGITWAATPEKMRKPLNWRWPTHWPNVVASFAERLVGLRRLFSEMFDKEYEPGCPSWCHHRDPSWVNCKRCCWMESLWWARGRWRNWSGARTSE